MFSSLVSQYPCPLASKNVATMSGKALGFSAQQSFLHLGVLVDDGVINEGILVRQGCRLHRR